jgi:lysophospholipid acyltransferase (LPLAT)-like uncharacterized protein
MMKDLLSQYSGLLGYSEKYGVHLGPYEDGQFSLSSRFVFLIGIPLGVWPVTLAYRTSRVRTVGAALPEEILSEGRTIIFAHWHRYAQYYYFWARGRRHVMMISQKEGGEYGARCMARVGVLSVRGSTSSLSRTGKIRNKKGKEALAAMVGLVRDEGFCAGLTVDGPKGPALALKMGAVTLAKETGSPIVVMTAAARPHATLFSWDKMWVPLPFSKIVYFFTGPFYVPRNAGEAEKESIRVEVEAHMRDMAQEAERYFFDEAVRKELVKPVSGARPKT